MNINNQAQSLLHAARLINHPLLTIPPHIVSLSFSLPIFHKARLLTPLLPELTRKLCHNGWFKIWQLPFIRGIVSRNLFPYFRDFGLKP